RGDAVRAVEARRSVPPPKAAADSPGHELKPVEAGSLKAAFLEEIRKTKKFFHGTVVAQALAIEVQPDAITFVFAPQHRALRAQLEQSRTFLETTASQLAGRRMAILA